MKPTSAPIAYLISRYPAVSHTFILREIIQLRALGHTIHTASINPPDRDLAKMDAVELQEAQATYCIKADGAAGGLKALLYWLRQSPGKLLAMLQFSLHLGHGLRGLAYGIEAAMVARWMNDLKVKQLHVHFGNAGATVGLLTKRLNDCHLSYTIHGPDEFDDVPGQHLALKMREANAVICISQFARSQLMRISDPLQWPKFRLCRLGVDPRQFAFNPSHNDGPRLRLVSVGRLTPAKGQVLLVQACALLRDAGIDFSLTIVGDGPDRQRVTTAVERLHLGDQITLTGALTQEGVRQALSAADVFVLPSLAEGIPVVLMEAMSWGVPCVSTPVNGIPELIEHGHTGLLALPGDVNSLFEQLQSLAGNSALCLQIAKAARLKVERDFDLPHNVRKLGAIFAGFEPAPFLHSV